MFSSTPKYFILSFNPALVTPHNRTTSRISHVLVAILSRVLVIIHWSEFPNFCSRKTLLYGESGSLMVKFDLSVLSGAQEGYKTRADTRNRYIED